MLTRHGLPEFLSNLCANCGEREGTQKWVANGGVMDLIHGFYEMWCEVCCLTKQIEFAEERAAEIPVMRARLKELTEA